MCGGYHPDLEECPNETFAQIDPTYVVPDNRRMLCKWKHDGRRCGGHGHLIRHHLRQNRHERNVQYSIPRREEASSQRVQDYQKFSQQFHTVVINLDRRPDRWEQMQENVAKIAPDLVLQRRSAVDGKSVREEDIPKAYVGTHWNRHNNEIYKKAQARRKGWPYVKPKNLSCVLESTERACAMSHIRAWESHVSSGRKDAPLLVLEDDAKLQSNFLTVLQKVWEQVPSDADILYLGYSKARKFNHFIGPHIARCPYVWSTIGYIVMPGKVERLLKQLPVDQPIDNWLAMQQGSYLSNYCVTPKLVYPARQWNEDSDVAHSDEVADGEQPVPSSELGTVAASSLGAQCPTAPNSSQQTTGEEIGYIGGIQSTGFASFFRPPWA